MPIIPLRRALSRFSLVTFMTIGFMSFGAIRSFAEETTEGGSPQFSRVLISRNAIGIGGLVSDFVHVVRHAEVEFDQEAARQVPHVPVIWPSVHGTRTSIQVSKAEIPVGVFPALPGSDFRDVCPLRTSDLPERRYADITITPEPTQRGVFGTGGARIYFDYKIPDQPEFARLAQIPGPSFPAFGYADAFRKVYGVSESSALKHSYSDPGYRIEEVSLPSFSDHAPIAPRP